MSTSQSNITILTSNPPSDIINTIFTQIPISSLVSLTQEAVDESIHRHIMYYIRNHIFSNQKISCYLINHPLYKQACIDKLSQVSDTITTRFLYESNGAIYNVFSDAVAETTFTSVHFDMNVVSQKVDFTHGVSNLTCNGGEDNTILSTVCDSCSHIKNDWNSIKNFIFFLLKDIISNYTTERIITMRLITRTFQGGMVNSMDESSIVDQTLINFV